MKRIPVAVMTVVLIGLFAVALPCAAQTQQNYEHKEAVELVGLVKNAAALIESKGEAAFMEFKKEGSPWRRDKIYVFIIDTDGNMIVHPDPTLEGKNQIDIRDINGKPVIKGIIEATISGRNKNEGWFFYQWPEPNTIFSSWKATFARRVAAPSGKTYVACCGLHNLKMEDIFLVDTVNAAAALIEKEGKSAFNTLRDKSSQFVFLGTYIFVDTPQGIEVVNGGFPDVEGKNLFDYKDPNGKYLTREIINTALTKGSGWVDYLWPKPGKINSSKKHTYVKKAVYGGETFAVGAGAYLDTEPVYVVGGQAEDIAGKTMVVELKSGGVVAGEIIRETKDSVYLESVDRSMEVSFPRDKIATIRKPTEKELKKIMGNMEGEKNQPDNKK